VRDDGRFGNQEDDDIGGSRESILVGAADPVGQDGGARGGRLELKLRAQAMAVGVMPSIGLAMSEL